MSGVLVILAALVALAPSTAQTHPDFSDTWTVDGREARDVNGQ
jgi:hypothetical protein